MVKVFLLLGSNLGNRHAFLSMAIDRIRQDVGQVTSQSAIYETQAWGKTDGPDYLNQVIAVQTDLPPHDVLDKILQIELMLGRERKEKWGARTIDIDILFYDDLILNASDLIIPHPELQNRRFTLEPLAEIAPGLAHPVLGKNMLELKFALQDCLVVKKL